MTEEDKEIGDMFAVNNLDGKRPGVALLPEVEEKEGERSIRAHLLRRVFAVIRLASSTPSTSCPDIAISYSQHGIQIGIGPNIHICRNQTILGAKQMIANFGYRRLDMDKKDLAGPDWWRPTVEGWIDEVRGISDLAFGNNAAYALKKVNAPRFSAWGISINRY